jgi:hypothetical protein
VGYQATWNLVSGQPGSISYCVRPEVEILGNLPWLSPLTVLLVDERTTEMPNENPNNAGNALLQVVPMGTPQLPSTQPHVKATFSGLSVVGPMPMQPGAKSGTQPVQWCVQNIPWVSRPELTLQIEGRSCRVNFKGLSPVPAPAGGSKPPTNQQR